MKILLSTGNPYVVGFGGAERSNRAILEGLVAAGHHCAVIAVARTARGDGGEQAFRRDLEEQALAYEDQRDAFRCSVAGVELHAIKNGLAIPGYLTELVREWSPDLVITTDLDFRHRQLAAAIASVGSERVVYIARSTNALPAGPDAVRADPTASSRLASVAATICSSNYLADYVQRWIGCRAHVIYPPVFGRAPFPLLGRFDNELVLLVNACDVKGLPILLATAAALPDLRFGAVPSWGTTAADRERLAQLPNIETVAWNRDFDQILARTRVLLVPSLYQEVFGQVVVQAMARGIPVIASNVGGLPEAKLGTDHVLPVRAIEHYDLRNGVPVPAGIPEQDCAPWVASVVELTSSRERWQAAADAGRDAALRFIATTGVHHVDTLLRTVDEQRTARR